MTDIDLFKKQLGLYKKIIDADIDAYGAQIKDSVAKNYSKSSTVAVDAYLKILKQGGKRIRGALTILGYEMAGGKNSKMILQAARAMEMLHSSMLILDDIADRSATRRGDNSAHIALSQYHKNHKFSGDSAHFGESIATVAALIGNYGAQMILANLPVEPELATKVLSITGRSMSVTIHGQINDIFNEVKPKTTADEVAKVLEWKTANYSLLNPLHSGMVLAGAGCEMTDAITPFALKTGIAFQISDDILSTFSQSKVSGKNPIDDIREGKRTLMIIYALENCSQQDKKFLASCLGNPKLTKTNFKKCRQILINSGAKKYAEMLAQKYIDAALKSLIENAAVWPPKYVSFLRGMTEYLLLRKA